MCALIDDEIQKQGTEPILHLGDFSTTIADKLGHVATSAAIFAMA